MKTVQPCYVKISNRFMSPCYDAMDFWQNWILICSSLCMYKCTLYIMPEFTPNNLMLKKHADKGTEDHEIYAECVREAMAKTGGLELCDMAIRDKLAYEKFLYEGHDEVVINGQVIYSLEHGHHKPKRTNP